MANGTYETALSDTYSVGENLKTKMHACFFMTFL
jgi:hypothetical protein